MYFEEIPYLVFLFFMLKRLCLLGKSNWTLNFFLFKVTSIIIFDIFFCKRNTQLEIPMFCLETNLVACNGVLTPCFEQNYSSPHPPKKLLAPSPNIFNSPVLILLNSPKSPNVLLPPSTGNKQDVKLMHKPLIQHT